MNDEQLMMVPRDLNQKVLVENHDVPIAGHVGSTKQWTSSNGITGGVVSRGMSQPTCGRVQCVNG